MTNAIKFGSSPAEIHSVGNLAPEIWDMIWTWKDICEKQDKLNHGMKKVLLNIDNVAFEYWLEYNRDRANYFEDKLYEKYAERGKGLDIKWLTHPSVSQQLSRACVVCRNMVLCTPTQETTGEGWLNRGWICSNECERHCTGEESDDEE